MRKSQEKKGTAKVTVCWKNKKRKKKTSVYLVKVSEKKNKATKKTLTAKENAMRVFRKQNEYRTAAGVGKLEWSDELYDFLIYRIISHLIYKNRDILSYIFFPILYNII